ncbi:MAG: hypothetical protein J5482_05920 [Oscillospiraceae bacterium]|nr:hypothetical protein [Oscillospiraceae bacterium]
MKFPVCRDLPALICDLCGDDLYPGDPAYRIHGETICPNCLETYARQVFSPYSITAGEEMCP